MGVFAPCVVIPVYNHEHAIATVVARVREHGLPIVLVDDGCNAGCAEVLSRLASQPEVFLVKHAENRGKGAAVCTGLLAAREHGFTHALQVDADGQHSLRDIPRFIDEARAHPDSLICGHPIFDSSIPKSRYYGRYLTHGLVWLETLSFDIIDSMCGFRLYPLAPVLDFLARQPVGSRMDFDTEILVRLHWRGVAMRWLPTQVTYPLDGVSHFRMYADNALMTWLHVRLVFGMLLRLPVIVARKFSGRSAASAAPRAGI